jgi:hypothetical protein
MTRHALIQLTGAGETTCSSCHRYPVCNFVRFPEHTTPRPEPCLSAEREATRLRAIEEAARACVVLLEQTRFMAIGGGPISEWAQTPEGKNHAIVWEALQALRAALKE